METQSHNQRRPSTRLTDRAPERIHTMHDVLSVPYRRAVLYYLTELENPADVSEMASQIQAWNPNGAEEWSVGTARARLLNDHILGMDEFGLLTYDSRRDTVRLDEHASISVAHPWVGDEDG